MNGNNENMGKFIPVFFIVTGIIIVLCGIFKELNATDRIIALAVGIIGIAGTITKLFLINRSRRFCRVNAQGERSINGVR